MSKITVNDISMYYEVHGSGEPILFIAGFSADHTIWSEIINHFKADYQLILFDNRGAGQTDVPKGAYTIEGMANDVVALCSKLGITGCHLVGNSMGGFIGQTLAFHHPNLIKSAVLSHSALTIQTPFHVYAAAQLELLKAQAPLPALIKASCSWAFSYQFLMKPGVLQQLIARGLDNPYPFTIQGYEGQYAALDCFDSRPWAQQILVPTLVLGSDQDLIFSESAVKLLAQQIPNATYCGFKNCGHLPQIEYPEQFSHVIKEFIARV